MSTSRHQPKHLIIREYLEYLLARRVFTRDEFAARFVDVYVAEVPDGEDVPTFQVPHKKDDTKTILRKQDTNQRKLWRAIEGDQYLPMCYEHPLLETLRWYGDQVALDLQRKLLRNDGWLAVPVPDGVNAKDAEHYSRVLKEFAEAHTAIANDLADDGQLNSQKTADETLDAIEALTAVFLVAKGKKGEASK